MSEIPEVVELCRKIAIDAHDGQVRKFGADKGKPYVIHPERMASKFNDIICKSVAWLHDVLEDTKTTVEDLRKLGVLEVIITAVIALTKKEGESYLDFIVRAKGNTFARSVKIVDIEDNMMSLQEGSLKEKYKMALYILQTPDEKEIDKAAIEWFDNRKWSTGNIPNYNMQDEIKRGFRAGSRWALTK